MGHVRCDRSALVQYLAHNASREAIQEDRVAGLGRILSFLIFPSLYITSGVPVLAASSRALRPARRSAASTPLSRPLPLVSFFCFTTLILPRSVAPRSPELSYNCHE